jgi:hypothetical protein
VADVVRTLVRTTRRPASKALDGARRCR